ncbi:hypothetical protein MJO29_006568 [Puccinia striiformis f. sp. tritici]|nr:hypothetical protein MJO29_006568 [Puccinia striiformis f. sp. tritici]
MASTNDPPQSGRPKRKLPNEPEREIHSDQPPKRRRAIKTKVVLRTAGLVSLNHIANTRYQKPFHQLTIPCTAHPAPSKINIEDLKRILTEHHITFGNAWNRKSWSRSTKNSSKRPARLTAGRLTYYPTKEFQTPTDGQSTAGHLFSTISCNHLSRISYQHLSQISYQQLSQSSTNNSAKSPTNNSANLLPTTQPNLPPTPQSDLLATTQPNLLPPHDKGTPGATILAPNINKRKTKSSLHEN